MMTVHDVPGLREARRNSSGPVALVPTMGALHSGHFALMREARRIVGPKGTLAVSIFVNPLQFDRPEDLQSYPRPLENDLEACAEEGVDLVFAPPKESLYENDHSVTLRESRLSRFLCGASRPGHFDGVLTIVLKLFHLFQPQFAVFGDKDFQQLALIRRMVRDLNHPVEIVAHPTVRDEDGLALSSRNRRLTEAQRRDAPRIPRALGAARDLAVTGQQSPAVYLDCARSHLLDGAPPEFSIDYLELVDPDGLHPLTKVTGTGVLAVACSYDAVRLIDHLTIRVA